MSDLKNKLEKIETYHTEGKNGVLEIISHKRTFKKLPFILSLCVSLTISIVILLFVPNKSFKILSTGCDLLIVIFPSLLGFSLGGYALIVGFGNIDLLKKATRINAYSIYQTLSAIFAISLMFQIFTTIFSFIVSWLIKVDLDSFVGTHHVILGNIANVILIFILLLTATYSFCLTPYLVTNLFTFSQANNLFLTVKKAIEEEGDAGDVKP